MTSDKIYTALTGAVLMVVATVPAVSADMQTVRIPRAAADQVLPAYEVVTIVRSTGLEPLEAPMRYGVTYRLRALDRAGRDLNVVVDARFGDILLVEAAMDGPYPERRRMVAIPSDYDDPQLYDRPPDMYSNVPPHPPRVIKPVPKPRVATVPANKRAPVPQPRPSAVAAQSTPVTAPAATAPAAAPPAPKAETVLVKDAAAPAKWKDEPVPTTTPAAATPIAAAPVSTPKAPDVMLLE